VSSNLYKSILFVILAIVFVVAKLIKKSVYSLGVTVFCVSVLLVLAIIFLVKYIKEKRTADK
jgi:Ca2+/Na+ antiporter